MSSFNSTPSPGACGIVAVPFSSVVSTLTISRRSGDSLTVYSAKGMFGVMAAIFSAFGRVVSEIGCSLMVGGNIAGFTRNIPTAIALETSKGEFAEGIALGFMLLAVALVVNFSLAFLQGEGGLK